ncbi:MAG: c-type cytochrome [Gemmatimonadaceae bacterium]|nr:c-type cytochrome [Gemmatimonadaceae bacterium]
MKSGWWYVTAVSALSTALWAVGGAFARGAPHRAAWTQGVAAPESDPGRGLALMNAFRDSLPRHSGNRLRCTSCHLDNGTRPNAMPWLGTAARYPRYRGRRGSEETITQRINECIGRSLAGRPLLEDSRDMRDMVAYLSTLKSAERPAGPDTVRLEGSFRAGRRVYSKTCARCHGATGAGLLAPAVWGRHSYSIGAGLARQSVLATFLQENMPYDRADTLSAQQAADVAAYVLAQPRQDHPGKELDWPKGDPPVDVAYATRAARAAGKTMPTPRPLLPRRVNPKSP